MKQWLCGMLAVLMLLGTFTDMCISVRAEEAMESTEATDPTETVAPTEPDVTEPEPTEPEPTEPAPTEPEPTEPDVTDPDVTDPDVTDPDTTDPDTTNPDTTDPDTTDPDVTDPDTTDPDTTDPDVTDPDTTDPDVTDPDTTDPDVTEPDATEPEPTEPEPTEPEPTEPPDPSLPVDMETATSSENLMTILKKMEGFNKYPYWDVSQWSVGYGTRCPDDKLSEYKANGITEEEALVLLRKSLDYTEGQVRKFATKYSLPINQFQFDALVSFSYNRGCSWMNNASHPLVLTLTGESSTSQILHDFSLYSVSQGSFILTRRRLSECYLYLEGVYEAYNTSKDGTYPSNYRYVYLDGNGGTLFKTNYYTYIMHAYDSNDPIEIIYNFSQLPTGTDADGNTFTYTLAGWYTAAEGGEKVELLDGSLPDGTVLYAHWADPDGNIVVLPKGDVCEGVVVTVTNSVNIRTGPGTYFPAVDKAAVGLVVTITETYTYAGTLWGKCEYGWLSLTYTNYNDVLYGEPDDDTGDGNENTDSQWPRSGTVTTNSVNVRSGPGTGNPIEYQLNKGDVVVIYDYAHDGTLEWGKLDDGNWICLKYVQLETTEEPPREPEEDPGIPGDVNGDELTDVDDAIYLLWYVYFPEQYPLTASADVNGSGTVDADDAIYLLWHIYFPELYPLHE